jgi:APA family basic amino acid/polyamine antiporter
VARPLRGPARGLSGRALALVAYGEIGTSLIFALGIVALYAVGLTPWVLLAVGALMLVVTLSYAEGSAAMPEAGGAATFVRRAFSDPLGFATGWLLFLDYIVVIALAAIFVPSYVGTAFGWDALAGRPWDGVLGILVIVALAIVRRVRRIRLFAVAAVAAAVALLVQAVIAVLGFALVFAADDLTVGMDVGRAPSWASIILALSLATLAYTGLETVTNLAAEVREPGRTLPRSLFIGIGTVVALNVAVSMVGVSAYPTHPDPDESDGVATDLATDWLQAPLVGIARAIGEELPGGADLLVGVVGVTNALILVTAIATSLAGGERLAYAMARYDMLPHAFARPERGSSPTPAATLAAAVIAPALIVVADLVGDGALFLAGLYSFGVLIAMTLAQFAVVRLRIREPGLARPFRVPLGVPWRGAVVPLPSLVGGVLTLALWVASLFTHGGAAVVGPVWLAIGAVVYLVSRRAGGETLMGRATPPVPDLVAGEPGGGARRILVPLKLADIGEEVLATALRLAEERGAEVQVLHVVRVPMSLPLDSDLGDAERLAREAMDEAREIAAEQGVDLIPRLVRARSLSEAIVAEADAAGADLIVMGSAARWRRHKRFFSPTVDAVLRRAPCEVMVVTYPEGVLDGDEAS